MGMSTGSGRGIRNDINVTPLIDVVLVLLIIFLVTMPGHGVAATTPGEPVSVALKVRP